MNNNMFSPISLFNCLNSTFSVLIGRKTIEDSFGFSSIGFWQAIIGSWILGMIMAVAPASNFGVHFILTFATTSLVSILIYSLIVWHFLILKRKSDRYLYFLVPYFWVGNLQIVIFGIVTLVSISTGNGSLQFFLFPVVIWIFFWLYKIAKDQTELSGFYAICLLVFRLGVEIILGMAAGIGVASIS